jgi:site-specific DNA recombinase
VRSLRAEGGVVAVAGVEPGLVGEGAEELGLDVVDEGAEVVRIAPGVADAAGEPCRVSPVNTSGGARVALYARISEDTTGEKVGVARQLEACRELAESRGWAIIAELTDNDVSALTGKHRPGYDQVLALVSEGQLDHVVVWQTSRLLRNRKERAAAIELFGKQRVGIITVKGQDLDLSTAYGRGMAGMLGEFDTMESEVKSERVAAAAADRARHGRPNSNLGYGWEKHGTGSTATWTEHPEQAEVVRTITKRLLAGESLLGITRDLNDQGVPAPNSARWGKTSVAKIAQRSANAGIRVHHRGRSTEALYEGSWPQLVTREDWQRVCGLLAAPQRRSNGTVRPGARRHLLTWGIGACGVCGGKLRVGMKGNAQYGTKKELYLCDEKGCVGRDKASVDQLIRGVIISRLSQDDALDWLLGDDQEARRLGQRAEQLRQRLDDAADQYADGRIDGQQLERITARLRPQLEKAQAAHARAARSLDLSVLRTLAGPQAEQKWDAMPLATQRAVVETLGIQVHIERVTRRGPGFDPASVRVEWRDTGLPGLPAPGVSPPSAACWAPGQ